MSTETTPYCYRHPNRETHIRCQRCGRPICPDCMNQAAVGFQCPSCVREGRKTTRAPQAAYGGRPSANPARTSQVLIGINLAVWLLITATGGRAGVLLSWFALLPLGRCERPGGMAYIPGLTEDQCASVGQMVWVDGVASGAWWQVVTSVFTHVDFPHIAVNMLLLWFLGPQLEAVVGRTRFLAVYFLAGLTGSAFVLWLSPEQQHTVGASGAILGLLGALLVIAVKTRRDYSWLLLLLGMGVLATLLRGDVSWQGHLGGFLGGAMVALALVAVPRRRRAMWQLPLLGLFGFLTILAMLVRVITLSTPSVL